MSAIGAVTSSSMLPYAPGVAPAGMPSMSGAATVAPARAAAAVGFVGTPGQNSGVQGYDFAGDVLTDRALKQFASNPLAGGLEGAIDSVSAGFSFNPANGSEQRPVPGTDVAISPSNALLGLRSPGGSAADSSFAARLSPSEFIARSQSNIALGHHLMRDALTAGQGIQKGYAEFADQLRHVLRPDASGRNAFDHQTMALEVQKQELVRQLKEKVGDPRLITARLMSLTIAQGMVQREREKHEELLKLIISLMLGVQIPKGCVERLQALGLGPVVEELIQNMVGNGKGLSKSLQEQIRGLEGLGINVSILQEQDTEVGQREALLKRAQDASITADGRLVDPFGRTVEANAVRGDLADVLRRRAAGVAGNELLGGVLATAGDGGAAAGTNTAGTTDAT